jgi:hypothetical protein
MRLVSAESARLPRRDDASAEAEGRQVGEKSPVKASKRGVLWTRVKTSRPNELRVSSLGPNTPPTDETSAQSEASETSVRERDTPRVGTRWGQ